MSQQSDDFERFREYLMLLAEMNLSPKLRVKVGASDIVQQTMLQAHRALQEFRGTTDNELAAWLRRILARNVAHAVRDWNRNKRNINLEKSLNVRFDASSARLDAWIASDASSPSAKAVQGEMVLQLAEVIQRLPESQREAIRLHYWQGWTLAKIGERLDRTPAAVAGLIRRGLKTLHKEMQSGDIL